MIPEANFVGRAGRNSAPMGNVTLASPQNIILVGFMATGKSYVGGILSQCTGWPLVDTDEEIVRRAGKLIHQIFQAQSFPGMPSVTHIPSSLNSYAKLTKTMQRVAADRARRVGRN